MTPMQPMDKCGILQITIPLATLSFEIRPL